MNPRSPEPEVCGFATTAGLSFYLFSFNDGYVSVFLWTVSYFTSSGHSTVNVSHTDPGSNNANKARNSLN